MKKQICKNCGQDMKVLTIEEKEEIINRYAVTGIPHSNLKRMCEEVQISYPELLKELRGQTCGLVGGEPMIYPWDVIRFMKGLPCLD